MAKYKTVDHYIGSFPPEIQKKLKEVRTAIRKSAPKAEELISYNMPGYKLNGMLIYFAANKNHIGLYPVHLVTGELAKKLEKYRTSKATARFDYDKKLPLGLISRIVKQRVKQNLEKQ